MSTHAAPPIHAHLSTSSKKTFVSLEGMRGVAAIAVMVAHIEQLGTLHSAYLAVDLFFALSGFVLSYRYLAELRSGLSPLRFMQMRAIRLYPLYLLGTLISFVLIMFKGIVIDKGHTDQMPVYMSLLAGIFGLPYHVSFTPAFYPLNGPAWTLLAEFGVNIVFALIAPFIGKRLVWFIILIGGIGLCWQGYIFGELSAGPIWQSWQFLVIRVTFSFFVGVQLFHYWNGGRFPKLSIAPGLPIAILVPIFFLPRTFDLSGVILPAIVILAFPTLLILGIESEPKGRLDGIMRVLGDLSYPLYAIHIGLLLIPNGLEKRLDIPPVLLGLAIIPCVLLAAWLSLRYYDIPVRRRLTQIARAHWAAQQR